MFQTLWDLDIQIPEPFTTLEILVPVLLVFAPHLADELVPRLLRGDDMWAQAFSEPDAGSDLASLRTRLEPDALVDRVEAATGDATRVDLIAGITLRAVVDGAAVGAMAPRRILQVDSAAEHPGVGRSAKHDRRGVAPELSSSIA